MRAFRAYLAVLIVCLGAYTLLVGLAHGWNLLPVFLGDMAAMTWPGQFNAKPNAAPMFGSVRSNLM